MRKLKDSYWSPTPKNLRIWGDFILGLSLVLSGYVAQSPIPDAYKVWIMFLLTTTGGVCKYVTNFFKEKTKKTNDNPIE